MIFGFKIEFGFFAENFYYLVVFLFAGKKVVVGHIRQPRDVIGNSLLIFVDLRVARGNLFAYGAHTRENFFYGLTLFFKFGYLRRNFISFGF